MVTLGLPGYQLESVIETMEYYRDNVTVPVKTARFLGSTFRGMILSYMQSVMISSYTHRHIQRRKSNIRFTV